ncbi:MAG: hypothetical protein JJV91_01405 [Desulfosarcina sp.]|nr:hypothetical protein [Desulfobacterales bacterium]
MKQSIFFIFFFFIFSLPGSILAVEVAPRISDREIIEKLAGLEAGQIALRSEMKAGQAALGKRMDDMSQSLNQRISTQQTIMLALCSSMVALILALFAYIAWDRRTMLKPVVQRLEVLEKDVLRDLDINHKDGSLLIRLVNAMRELAKHDEKVASVLRNFSLL